jgi:hypothetical protein
MTRSKHLERVLLGIVVVSLVCMGIVGFVVQRNSDQYRDSCKYDGECGEGQTCQYSSDFGRKICVGNGMRECPVAPESLVACDLNSDQCDRCTNAIKTKCMPIEYGSPLLKSGTLDSFKLDTDYSPVNSGGGNGHDMRVRVVKDDGGVRHLKIMHPGYEYNQGDVLTLNGQNGDIGTGETLSPEALDCPDPCRCRTSCAAPAECNSWQFYRDGGQAHCFLKDGNELTPTNEENWGSLKTSPGADNLVFTLQQQPHVVYLDSTPLPESSASKGWCIADVEDHDCNAFTSTKVLTRTPGGAEDEYAWKCECLDSKAFSQIGEFDDCNVQHVCGYPNRGELYVLSNPPTECTQDSDCASGYCCTADTGSGLCSAPANPGEKKHCYVKWAEQQNTDPADGRCVCQTGFFYETTAEGKSCNVDPCQPKGTSVTGSNGEPICSCPVDHVACPDPHDPDNVLCSNTNERACVPDPCYVHKGDEGKGGHWNSLLSRCECPEDEDGHYKSVAMTNAFNQDVATCQVGCRQSHCPRDTCYIENNQEYCSECDCPFDQVAVNGEIAALSNPSGSCGMAADGALQCGPTAPVQKLRVNKVAQTGDDDIRGYRLGCGDPDGGMMEKELFMHDDKRLYCDVAKDVRDGTQFRFEEGKLKNGPTGYYMKTIPHNQYCRIEDDNDSRVICDCDARDAASLFQLPPNFKGAFSCPIYHSGHVYNTEARCDPKEHNQVCCPGLTLIKQSVGDIEPYQMCDIEPYQMCD